MKRTLLSTLVITSTLGLSANVFALGMGELELKSTLNQPLQAEIELTNIDDLTEWEIKPSLASDGDFDRAGVEKIFFLSDIDFEVKGNRIVLSSDKSVTEPFLNFLVQVNWPSGRVLREYTLLLDPPVFDEQVQPLAATDVPQRVETQSVAKAQPENRWQTEAAAPGTYKVQQNDTLWEIAINTRPNRQVTPQQMMLAIQDGNPGAFIGGNINRLKTHQVLRIPTEQQMAARNDGQAISEVMRQNRELQTAGAQLDATAKAGQSNEIQAPQDGGELKLISKQSQVSDSAGASGDVESGVTDGGRTEGLQNDLAIALETLDTSNLENDDLKQRLASLEEQIATLQRLVSLKDDQLASIQTLGLQDESVDSTQQIEEVAEQVQSEIVEPAAEIAATVSEEVLAEETVGEGAVDDFNYSEDSIAEVTPEVTEPVQPLADTTPVVDPALAANQIQQQVEDRYKPKGLVAEVMAKPALMGGLAGGLALLLGLIGFAIKKRRNAKEGEIDDPELAAFDENFEFGEEGVDDTSLDDFEFDENEDSVTAEELTDDLLEGIGPDTEIEADGAPDTVAQTADIIGEAEIYIAYGRFDQAADLLKNSIQSEPSRIDLRMKLLEVFVETDDSASFAEAELDLNSIGDLEANEKAVSMRSRLSAPIDGEEEIMDMGADLAPAEEVLDMEGLADLDDEFSDGIDFEAALDLSDAEDFSASLDALDDDGLDFDLGSEGDASDSEGGIEFDLTSESEVPTLDDLDDVPTLDSLDDVPTLDSLDDVPTLDSLDDVPTLDSLDDVPTLDGLEEIPALDELEDVPTLDGLDDLDELSASLDDLSDEGSSLEIDDLEFGDLETESLETADFEESLSLENLDSSDEIVSLDDLVEPDSVAESIEPTSIVDLAALDSEENSDIAELENLLDSDEPGTDLPDLSFDLEETGFEGDALENDLQSLEAELDDLTIADSSVELEVSEPETVVATDLEAEPTLGDFQVEDDLETSSEFDLNELDDLPDFTAETAEQDVIAEDQQASKEIDLDELAASDNEFDFLAGTDECATKLDLARAYLDMEDNEGAKELLQEVVTEGSDQQKHDARALLDSIG